MRRSIAVVAVIMVTFLVAVAQQVTAPETKTIRRPPPKADTRIKQDLSEALTLIEKHYAGNGNLNYNDLFKASFSGMLHALDPHSSYFDKKEFDDQQAAWSRSEYYGIGATIGERRINGDVSDTFVLAAFEESPAFRAGLRYGDRIVEIDGKSTTGKASTEVRDKLRGPRSTNVRITVERASSGDRQVFEITRDAVPQPTVPDAYMLRNGIGYVDMTRGFNRTTSEEVINALQELKGQGMTSLILDLRNNSGGFIVEAVRVAERFLGSGQRILDQRGTGPTSASARVYASQNKNPETLPIAILINRGTASAAEIVAGALQDQDRALLVGETSFGKGLVQTIYPLDFGSGLTLTTARYHTPSGRVIQRDYTNTSAYDYLSQGGVGGREDFSANQPKGPASKTASGRLVYGGGIAPDSVGAIKPRLFNARQQRLIQPAFAFAREVVSGRVSGFENMKVTKMPVYRHKLDANELTVDDRLFQKFREFVASKNNVFKFTQAQLDRERESIKRQLRYEMATAVYGSVTAQQVFINDDPQVLKAIELMPQARELSSATRP